MNAPVNDVVIKRPVGRPRRDPAEKKAARAAYMQQYYAANRDKMDANAAESRRRQRALVAAAQAMGLA